MLSSTRDTAGHGADSDRQLADYAMAFEFLGRLAGATTERQVIENVFDLFALLFAPSTMVYLSVHEGRTREVLARPDRAVDLEEAKAQMVTVESEHAWTRSGTGFDVRIGPGPTRQVLRVDGLRFAQYRERYLNLVLSVAPVLSLALSNARNFQLLRDEQAQLRSALRAREATLSVVSHDLRNPVASILVNADTLERQVGPGGENDVEQALSRVQAIRQSATRMNRLIEDLLDIRRIEAGVFTIQKTLCRVADVMHEVLRDLRPQAEAKGVRIVDACAGRRVLWCDRDRIVQVLCNLVGNAVKFAPRQSGVVTIQCQETETETRFTVRDNGAGIAAEELPHVFDMYWQGRDKKRLGVGLGLAIARGIVDAHGGAIAAESVLGRGATFRFSLPAVVRP